MSKASDRCRLTFGTLTGALENLCDPERLQRRPEYRKRPTEAWLGRILGALQDGRDVLSRAAAAGEFMTDEERRLNELAQTAWECADRSLPWVREQLHRELAALVAQYHSSYWVEAIRDGLPHEFWFVLSRRDDIEGYLRAPELLHKALHLNRELVRRVQETDALLRKVGPELWEIDAPTGWENAERELRHPRTHWWWWLDQADSEDDPPV